MTGSILVYNVLSAKARRSWTHTPALQTASGLPRCSALGSNISAWSVAIIPIPGAHNLWSSPSQFLGRSIVATARRVTMGRPKIHRPRA